MKTPTTPHSTASWASLRAHASHLSEVSLQSLMTPGRYQAYHVGRGDLIYDYSKQRLDDHAMSLLLSLAEEMQLAEAIKAFFSGAEMNPTEGRQVLHMALRAPTTGGLDLPSEAIEKVHEVRQQMMSYVESLHRGEIKGATGRQITTMVNIGIGGSDLGPRMVVDALADARQGGVAVHFVSNVDPSDLSDVLARVDPRETVFIVASKSFTTAETMANAGMARAWLIAQLGDDAVFQHFIALSTNKTAMDAFGIAPDRRFAFWDWVGGRFSVSSAIGLSVACAIGWERFEAFLAGMHDMDKHFYEAPFHENIPVLMGLIGIWNANFLKHASLAVLPYSQRLARFADFLQQLEMESNGKAVHRDGQHVVVNTCPIVWGQAGTNGQHAFYQLIHQGTQVVPCDFIAIATTAHDEDQHRTLLANCLAQSRALLIGRSPAELRMAGEEEQLIPHKTFAGDRPSSTLLLKSLSPYTLGQLIALYEHKVFVQGWIWGVYSFDQWGVQLGKTLAKEIEPMLRSGTQEVDESTQGLIEQIRSWQR